MKESFNFAVLKLDELESYLQNYDDALTQIDESQQNISTSVADSLVSRIKILNPLVVQTKGRAKINYKNGARWKGGMEEAVMKKRTCKSCGVLGNHDKRTFPLLKTMIAESTVVAFGIYFIAETAYTKFYAHPYFPLYDEGLFTLRFRSNIPSSLRPIET
ncbi:hypothetical protein GIB67_001698 [Kingdonia uniflora]|uniref:Uncharacterized protein n=1 Tax=Kingdonia uniflora TaxID=39325 RepID=A0A7J7LN39_9MAGN|nr:hypothetical protein GIB67_001698 [Kingdonia uniflora]